MYFILWNKSWKFWLSPQTLFQAFMLKHIQKTHWFRTMETKMLKCNLFLGFVLKNIIPAALYSRLGHASWWLTVWILTRTLTCLILSYCPEGLLSLLSSNRLYDVSIPCHRDESLMHSAATSVLHCRADVSLWCALFDMSQTLSSIVPSEKNRLFLVFTCLCANASQDSMSSSILSTSQTVSLISVMENRNVYRVAVGFLMASLAKVIIGCIHDFEGCASLFTFKVTKCNFPLETGCTVHWDIWSLLKIFVHLGTYLN